MPDAPIALHRPAIIKALGDPSTSGVILYTIALWTFGSRVLGDEEEGVEQMDPAEMWDEFYKTYGVWVPNEGENKLNAIITGLTDGRFWRDFEVFVSVAMALSDGDLGDLLSSTLNALDVGEMMWAMVEMELAWDAEPTPDFALDIQEYIERALRREQEDQAENVNSVELLYMDLLDNMVELGVPASILRVWDEEYAAVMEAIELQDMS